MTNTISRWSSVLLLGGLGLSAAHAAEPPTAADSAYATALPEHALATERGGELHLNQVAQASGTATQNGNSAYGNLNGGNWISDSAFSSSSGFSTAIQNSGNNVIIQNSLILNVTYAQ